MLKKIMLGIFTALFVITVTACGGPAKTWEGSWTADGFVGNVQGQDIEVHIVNSGSDTLYWKGTFDTESPNIKDGEIVSHADQGALSASLLGSQDATKTFTVKNGKISFVIQMMGVKRTVELAK